MKIYKKDLELPKIIPNEVNHSYAFLRPYRKGGIKIEHEIINDKHIIHNYGHGGSAICLAYGCAYISTKILTVKVESTKTNNIAVIGGGIVGITTALELLKRGYKVTIYAERFSKIGELDSKNRLSSQINMHYWYPGYYENEDPLKHELLAKLSYDYFKDCIKTSRYQSISWLNCYNKGPKNDDMQQTVTQFISQQFENVYINFGNEVLEEYLCFKTFLIDGQLLLEELITEAKLRNAILEVKKFDTLQDVLKLNQQCIFNCSGLGSKTLFDDSNCEPIRGHLVELPLFGLQVAEPFMIRVSEEDSDNQMHLYVAKDKFVVGTSWEKGEQKAEINNDVIGSIIGKASSFVKSRSLKPYKL